MFLVVITCLSLVCVPVFSDDCRLINMSPDGKEVLVPDVDHVTYNKLKPFIGKRYSAQDASHTFEYKIGICEPASDEKQKYKNIGIVQINLGEVPKDRKPEYVVGMYNQTQLMSGNDWIMIEYWGGDKYGTHCSQERRKAKIFITCDRHADDDNPGMKIIEENNGKNTDCYYLFEMSHKDACDERIVDTRMARSSGNRNSYRTYTTLIA